MDIPKMQYAITGKIGLFFAKTGDVAANTLAKQKQNSNPVLM